MLTDLQKAELYLKNKDMTFKYKEKESGISMNTLKKYITLPQRLKKASWSNVTKLARLYDDEVEKKKLKSFSPKDVAEFMDWMNKNIPEDFYGKKLRKIILENESLINSVGIEDFIAKEIYDIFTNSDDTLLNIN